ncbi:MAG: 16S rRNA (uracil(1498)-N(3))-methyltransferase [Muribaculaceae bacterium]|nr:16S rRNA (uracil(1498)-N(3))-methyltransferase [Muribaculaceae bacterium]
MIQFYAPDIAKTLTLPEADSQHCIRVLRMSAGDTVVVCDGAGSRYTCRIADAHPKRTLVEIVHRETILPGWSQQITVCIAPTKHMDRMEWAVEKLTEIGVNRIIPILCRHSERKEIKTERLAKIAVSAMKQSLKATLPEIHPMTPIADILPAFPDAQRYICYCDDTVQRLTLAREYEAYRDVCILIGPEGDFSPEEVTMALNGYAWTPVTLGPERLRTETAAIVAADTIHIKDQICQKI